jgi:hypothetical protein
MYLLNLLFLVLLTIFAGKPAATTKVFLEKGGQKQLYAYQMSGDKGKVSFKHLDAGSYRLLLAFPQQSGKYIEEKAKHQTLTKASYNSRTKTYYYQGGEGYFSIKISGLSKIRRSNFTAIFEEERDEEATRNAIAKFGAHGNGASVSLQIKAITAAQFKKATDKISQDISAMSIRGVK